MCGIVVHFGGTVDQSICEKSLLSLERRGPDSFGEWKNPQGTVWLGHRRLSIVDLSEKGSQPLKNENGTIFLVANGEIYNYPELRNRLEQAGHIFYSSSDSECLIHGYEEWGIDFVNKLEGMFAFVLWDEKRKVIVAARDAFGQKPLFLLRSQSGIRLGSTIECLLPFLESKPTLNEDALAEVLAFGYITQPKTIWKEIERIPPGHIFRWSAENGISINEYYAPPTETDNSLSDLWFNNDFPEICQQHLMADVPLAVFLSAGVDSTAVASTISKMGNEVTALTVGFSGTAMDESKSAKCIADQLGIPHRVISAHEVPVMNQLNEIYAYVDEPLVRSGIMSNWLISKIVGSDFKVALSGHGGDELFGGYKWYARNGFVTGVQNYNLGRRVRDFFSNNHSESAVKNKSVLHAHALHNFGRFLPFEIDRILKPLHVGFNDEKLVSPLEKYFVKSLPLKRALQRVDLMTFCSDSSLPKVDSASMAHSLEVRCPFLDRRLVNKALSMPMVPGEETDITKQILRNYLKSIGAPEPNKNKSGFSYKSFETLDKSTADVFIENSYFVRNGLFAKDWKTILNKSKGNESNKKWVFLNLAIWAEFQIAKGNL